MARRCKCKICKKEGNTDTFFKVSKGGKNEYYCSKQEYDNLITEQEKRKDLIVYIAEDILCLEEDQIVPPYYTKKINELNKFYDFEVIKGCFRYCKDNIQYWLNNKQFNDESHKVNYIMTIIKNNINEVYELWKFKKKQDQKQANGSFDVGLINEIEDSEPKEQSSNDGILDFLDEEDI